MPHPPILTSPRIFRTGATRCWRSAHTTFRWNRRSWWRRRSAPCPGPLVFLIEQRRAADALSLEHHQRNALGGGNILERVPIHQQEIGFQTLADGTDAVFRAQQSGGVGRGRLERHGRGNSSL